MPFIEEFVQVAQVDFDVFLQVKLITMCQVNFHLVCLQNMAVITIFGRLPKLILIHVFGLQGGCVTFSGP